jgi:hypothetical protein
MGSEPEFLALRGLLALEAGAFADSRRHFHQALDLSLPRQRFLVPLLPLGAANPLQVATLWAASRNEVAGSVTAFSGRRLALMCLEWLEEGEKK